MRGRNDPTGPDCRLARETIHALLDGDPIDPGDHERLAAHLADCAGCREAESELSDLQSALRRMPLQAFPEEALQGVWSRTVRKSRRRRLGLGGLDWRFAAAAALLAVAVLGWTQWPTVGPGSGGEAAQVAAVDETPSDEQLQRAMAETRLVLALTARALKKTERTAIRGVLADEVSGALRRVPIDLPESTETNERKKRESST